VLLLRLPRYDNLVFMQCILFVPVQPVSLRFLQSISTYSWYLFLVFCIICGYLINLVLLFSQVDIIFYRWFGMETTELLSNLLISLSIIVIIIITIIIILVTNFMQGIYNNIPEIYHVASVHSVAAVLHSQFVLHVMLFLSWNMFCTFTFTLSFVCVQSPLWLFLYFLNFVLSLYVAQVLLLL
jgi:hypothetical protein